MTPLEIWAAGQPARDARQELHREAMADPDYAAAHRAGIVAKVQREGPSSGRISRSRAGEFETPLGPPALKTTEQLKKGLSGITGVNDCLMVFSKSGISGGKGDAMNMDESLKIAPEVATKVSQVIQRPDGSEVRIVVELPWLPGMGKSVGVSVWHRQLATDNWRLCSSHPHPDSREMSVDEYVKRGRPEMFQKASHAEILKLANLLGKPV